MRTAAGSSMAARDETASEVRRFSPVRLRL
jgi:hypothetical protein